MRKPILLLCLFLVIAPAALAAKITTTDQLIAELQKKYANKWYRTATFVQMTKNFYADGTSKEEMWLEALSVPGSLRIDFTPDKSGNGILFTNNQIYVFKDGKIDSNRPLVHPLMLLGFDIYRLPQADVIEKLKGLEFDLSILREDKWQGRAVYVVGAKQGDLHSTQFWFDKKNLYFVRMLSPAGKDGSQTQEVQFNKYRKLGGGWIAPEVIFMTDGKVTTIEEYSEIRGNVTLDPRLFDPQYFATVHWKD
jgi:hypothetical protein